MMKICFITEGNSVIGLGHAKRTNTIIESLPDEFDVILIVNNDCTVINDMPDSVSISTYNRIEDIDISDIRDSNIYVIDLYDCPPDLTANIKKGKPSAFIVILDCFKNILDADLYINLFDQGSGNYSVPFYREGLQYAIIRDSFIGYRKNKDKDIKDVVKKVLISFGGADPGNNTQKALDLLDSFNEEFDIDLIIGPAFNKKEFNCINQHVTIHQNVNDIAPFLHDSDIAITGCGTTLFEVCYMGIPAVLIPQNIREHNLGEHFISKNCACSIQQAFSLITNYDFRKNMSNNQKKLIDGKGKYRILDDIITLYNKRGIKT